MSRTLIPNQALRTLIPNAALQWQGPNDLGGGGPGAVLMNQLVAYYPLDEVSGNAIDAHGIHDGVETPAAGVGTVTPGLIFARGRDFVAPNTAMFQVANHANFAFTTGLTVAGFLEMDNAVANMCIMAKYTFVGGGDPNTSWAFQCSPNLPGSGAFRVFIGQGASDSGSNFANYDSTNIANDTKYHAAMVFDGTLAEPDRVKVYLNAVVMTPSGKTGTWVNSLRITTSPILIGSFQNLGRFWQGELQGWAIAGRAWSAAEVALHYNGGAGLTYPYG